ncbi:NAD(P)-dependent dehydrogenase, short-chain alcohol dehydrogenase family [Novosphingobium sp. CF614]|uniref:SDR family NAD(P)-dependent oxidoreductase n=1 Tax=Novosphingobium sp. CF614 TaxID=1884364 RepID=UPI0008E0C0C0|nr:SDR family NAD(P)-dependent oxidoreductase [Novosphingobium sp. CF614]SFF77482.1 NAD(P)-dependent dehydrogenase, short-chain alcohol dehydrogenase family [Novosphingobium sp. CF614]
MSELRFDGKVAIITGAGRGVGRTHAIELAKRGARIVVVDPGVALDGSGASAAPAEEVVNEIKALGGEAVASFEKVNDVAGAARMVELALDSFGGLDILINNAGTSVPELFDIQTLDQFRMLNEVHYLGTVYVTKAAWPHLCKARNARLVNTISEGPLGIHERGTGYGGAKAGVIGLTLTLAAEAKYHGVGVNGFAPRIATRLSAPDVLAHVYDRPAALFEKNMAMFPPELSSPAALYLAHESCKLNGVLLAAGGGLVLRMSIMENAGYKTDDISVESIAANIDQILDMSSATQFGIGATPFLPEPVKA